MCVLAAAACEGRSTNIKLQLVTQTSTYSQDFYLVKSFRGRDLARLKHRAVPLHRLLIIVFTATAAAAMAFVVLRCFWDVRLGHRSKGVQRSLVDAGNKDVLGACGVAPDDQHPDAPATSSKGGLEDLTHHLRHVLGNMEELSVACTVAALQMPLDRRLSMVSRLAIFALLELGALAVLLDGPLEIERKRVVQVVLDAARKVLSRETGGLKFWRRRYRLNRLLRQLQEVKNNTTKGASLAPKKRQQMLLDLLSVQKESVGISVLLTKELAGLSSENFEPFSVEATLLEKKLALLCHRRKTHILTEKEFCEKLQDSGRLANCNVLGLHLWLARSEALRPPPSPFEQIQQLHAALVKAEETVAQQGADPDFSLRLQPEDDEFMSPQQAESSYFDPPAPAASATQIQPAHHPRPRPDTAEGPPHRPQHQEGLMIPSQPVEGSHQAHPGSSSKPFFRTMAVATSSEQPHHLDEIPPPKGPDHHHPPADSIPSGHSQAASLVAPSSQPLHAEAPRFFPAAQSRTPGAHRPSVAFYGFPRGEPAPPGHMENSYLDSSDPDLKALLQDIESSLNAFHKSP